MGSQAGPSALRESRGHRAEARPIELFFDLVFVLAITQLTRFLVGHLTWAGAGGTLLLLLGVWGAWVYTSWVTNYFDPDARSVRVMLLAAMLASLVMSASLPQAFGADGLRFALPLVAIQVGRMAFGTVLLRHRHRLSPIFERALVWWAATGVVWVAGGLETGAVRIALWGAAVIAEYGGVALGLPVPGLGRSRTSDYTIAGAHIAERCQAFVMLALGESIVVIGSDFGELSTRLGVTAFVVAFVGSVALWWLYFDRAAPEAQRVIAAASDPGRLALSAYTYFHLPMLAGIIVAAAADEVVLAHPGARPAIAGTALILGGPACYLVGNALFKWSLWRHGLWSRAAGVLLLGALIPAALVTPALGLLAAATGVLVLVAASDADLGAVRRRLARRGRSS